MAFFTYILASRRNGTLYTGSTDDLIKRVAEYRDKLRPGFTSRYGVALLVWYETHERAMRPSFANARSRNGNGPGSWS